MIRGKSGWLSASLVLLAGCASGELLWPDRRPPTTPAPPNVRTEIRDARFFLPFPDQTGGPETGMHPREMLPHNQ